MLLCVELSIWFGGVCVGGVWSVDSTLCFAQIIYVTLYDLVWLYESVEKESVSVVLGKNYCCLVSFTILIKFYVISNRKSLFALLLQPTRNFYATNANQYMFIGRRETQTDDNIY